MPTATMLPKRQDVPQEYTWNIESIYTDNAAWEADFKRLEQEIPTLATLAGTLGDGSNALLEAIQKIHDVQRLLEHLWVYASLRRDENTADPTYQALYERIASMGAKFGTATSFFDPELLSLPDDRIDSYLQDNAELKLYTHYLDELRRLRAHVRSAEVEAVLAAVGEVTRSSSTTFGMLNDADIKFPMIKDESGQEVELTKSRYIPFMESKDRRVRKDAFEALYGTYGRFRNTIGATLSGSVRRDVFEARARGYESALAAALEPDAIPLTVYHNLVDTINKNLHQLHRFWRVRKQILGVDELHMYDVYVPLTRADTVEVSYDEGRKMVEAGLAPLGAEYIRVMHEGLYERRWIDVFENQGKRGGAYSSGSYTTQPFVLLNYQNNLNNVYTLAHELGHSMHSHFTRTTQPYVYGQYTIFVAEVASTLNEALLTDHLLKSTEDRAVKLQIVNRQLDDLHATLFRQTMFAEFELAIHTRAEAGEALTAEIFTEIYRELQLRYFGPEMNVDEAVTLEWARIPHFYRGFYVYKYATGVAAASALAQQILQEGEPAVERYLQFLRSGGSKTSIELLRGAGVDMTSPEPVERAIDLFGSLIDQLEQLVHQAGNGQG